MGFDGLGLYLRRRHVVEGDGEHLVQSDGE